MATNQASSQSSELIALIRDLILNSNVPNPPGSVPAPPPQPPPDQNTLVTVLTAVLGVLAQRQEDAVKPETGNNLVIDDRRPPLTPVNAALGRTIGRLLNGKKTVISIGAILATAFLPLLQGYFPEDGDLRQLLLDIVNNQTPILAVAGAGALWGALGKIEKWFATRR